LDKMNERVDLMNMLNEREGGEAPGDKAEGEGKEEGGGKEEDEV
jgi:hypothetical protein